MYTGTEHIDIALALCQNKSLKRFSLELPRVRTTTDEDEESRKRIICPSLGFALSAGPGARGLRALRLKRVADPELAEALLRCSALILYRGPYAAELPSFLQTNIV
jgi:hypothetical protein